MVTDLAEPRKLNPKSAAGKARIELIYMTHQKARNWWLWTRHISGFTNRKFRVDLFKRHFPSQPPDFPQSGPWSSKKLTKEKMPSLETVVSFPRQVRNTRLKAGRWKEANILGKLLPTWVLGTSFREMVHPRSRSEPIVIKLMGKGQIIKM